jgi:predicted RND superfamily exporter protein
LDELEKGHDRETAIRTTLREIGLATFITCVTTAIGFASLLTNRTAPIQGFGLNAALGVVTAFFVIYGWLWAMLPRLRTEQLIKFTPEYAFWGRSMERIYHFTRRNGRGIAWTAVGLLALCLVGMSQINTNYRIKSNLPRGQKITDDFAFFERKFSGFRPVEFAVFPQNGRSADDFAVLREMDKFEQHLRGYAPMKTLVSINDVYRSVNAMQQGNRPDAYRLPDSLEAFEQVQRLVNKMPPTASEVLLSKNRDKARIAGRMQDVGRDSVELIQNSIENWQKSHIDSSVARFKVTGTGVILDKNSAYIRDNMLQGLIPSVLVVAIIMGFLFKDLRMVLVFTVPNVFPLFFAGALIGFLGIPLEAGIATVFSIVFGIATDDTVHFLSTFKLCRSRGLGVEEALRTTLAETGKAMCLGSLILFFSFLVMLFSIHPPSVTVGLLVSVTLAGALFCDLLLVPVLVRRLIREQ